MSAVIDMNGWVRGDIFGFPVEIREIKRPAGKAYIKMPVNTHKGVLHTTQGNGIEAAWDTLKAKTAAPHFLIGQNRIMQLRPLGVQSAALIDPGNRLAYVQIENCGFTGGEAAAKDENHHAMDSWQFQDSTRNPLAATLAFLHQKNIIPLRRAYPWPDNCKDMKGVWARVNNTRRVQKIYNDLNAIGWFGHIEVPENNHYDIGAYEWEELFKQAQAYLTDAVTVSVVVAPPAPPATSKPPVIHTVKSGESFYAIARIYGVTPESLARRNNMTFKTVLMPGQLLTVPQ
jgi:LysM repeat protein